MYVIEGKFIKVILVTIGSSLNDLHTDYLNRKFVYLYVYICMYVCMYVGR